MTGSGEPTQGVSSRRLNEASFGCLPEAPAAGVLRWPQRLPKLTAVSSARYRPGGIPGARAASSMAFLLPVLSSSSIGEEVGGRSVLRAELIVQPHLPLYIPDKGRGRCWKDPGRGLGQHPDRGIYTSGVRLEPSGKGESRVREPPLPECSAANSRWPSEKIVSAPRWLTIIIMINITIFVITRFKSPYLNK